MFMFQSEDERVRHKSVDSFLAVTSEAVHDEAFAQELPRTQRNLSLIMDNYLYVPNIRHEEVIVPRKHNNDTSIPVIAVYDDQALNVTSKAILSQHMIQKARTTEYIEAVIDKENKDSAATHAKLIGSEIEMTTKKITVDPIPETAGAFVLSPISEIQMGMFAKIGAQSMRYIKTRPMMLLPVQDTIPTDAIMGVHELEHVHQGLMNPVTKMDRRSIERASLEDELRAYAISVDVTKILYHFSKNERFKDNLAIYHPLSFHVDAIRKEHNKNRKNKFEPTETLRAALIEKNGYDIAAILAS